MQVAQNVRTILLKEQRKSSFKIELFLSAWCELNEEAEQQLEVKRI